MRSLAHRTARGVNIARQLDAQRLGNSCFEQMIEIGLAHDAIPSCLVAIPFLLSTNHSLAVIWLNASQGAFAESNGSPAVRVAPEISPSRVEPIASRAQKRASRPESMVREGKTGAACVTRTRDPIITNDVLYQLS